MVFRNFVYICSNIRNGVAIFILKMNISSSNIKTADYNKSTRTLSMVFINRPRWEYTYYNVPLPIWTRFIASTSKGEYFSAIIRDVYRYTRKIN